MDLIVQLTGDIRCIYTEQIDLVEMGQLSIRRGSHVEPDPNGSWFADLSPVFGPKLGPFLHRSEAIDAEISWLTQNWLCRGS